MDRVQAISKSPTNKGLTVDVGSVRKTLPFDVKEVCAPGTADRIAADHILELFSIPDAIDTLKKWRAALRPGGTVDLTTANLGSIIEQYIQTPESGRDSELSRTVVEQLFGIQANNVPHHKSCYDSKLVEDVLKRAGFEDIEVSSTNGSVRAEARNPVNESDNMPDGNSTGRTGHPRILVESIARVFGDSLLSYPLTAIFRAKHPDAHVAYAAGKVERPLFEIAETIDEVTEKTVDNPSVPLNDHKYDIILRGAFDVDEKWHPNKFIAGFDGPDGWDKVLNSGHKLRFNYPDEDIRNADEILSVAEGRKKIMLFIPTYRPNMSVPWEISGWDIHKYQRLVDILNTERDDLYFFTFFSFQEIPDKLVEAVNVTDLGRIAAFEEVLLFSKVDLLISISTAVSAMIAPLVETPQIVIHTCGEDESAVWAGIPNKCVLPQLRFTYLCSEKTTGEVISFVMPEQGGRIVEWDFNHYWDRAVYRRRMRSAHDIEPEMVAEEVIRRLDHPTAPGKEWFIPQGESVCNSCRLKQERGICIYDFEPRLRNGLWMGESTGSVMLTDDASCSKLSRRLSDIDLKVDLNR